MKCKLLLLLVLAFLNSATFSQVGLRQLDNSIVKIDSMIRRTDRNDSMIMTPIGLNVFLQRKTVQYLTGTADLSLAKFYAAYTTDNDKLNLGFNFAFNGNTSYRLKWVVNPILEADVKKNFSKLYENDDWQNNIRGGLKITYLFGNGSLSFYKRSQKHRQKGDFMVLRSNTFKDFKDKHDGAALKEDTEQTLYYGAKAKTTHSKKLSRHQLRKKERELFEKIGIAEADYMAQERAYSRFRTSWLSIWGFAPLSRSEYYISPGRPQAFAKQRYKLWEANIQYTHLHDWEKAGTFYWSGWIKTAQNNSANAELMTGVDFNQYNSFPVQGDTLNYAQIATNKAFTGAYDEFMTTSLYLQSVYFPPVQWTIKPGLSIRYEKNWGDWSPVNWRLGIPVTIQGKDKPINIELQYRLSDVGNYRNKEDHKIKRTLGVSLGFPIVLLYK